MQKALTKKTAAKKAHADSRELLALIQALIDGEGGKFEVTIRASKCSHALIDLKNAERFRILVEAL